MGSIETIIRYRGTGGECVRYRAVPWDAIRGRKGPTRSCETEEEAYAYLKAWEARNDRTADAAGLPPTRRIRRVLVSDYARTYARTTPGEKSTKRDRLAVANRIGEEFAGVHLDELTRHEVVKWDGEIADRMAPGTRRKRMSFLKQMCKAAIRDGYMQTNPCDDIPAAPRVAVRHDTVPSEFEMERIIRWVPAQLKVMVLLAASSGMRAGEVCGLTWRNVDLHNGLVHIRAVREWDGTIRHYTKGKTHRTVPLTPRTVAALKAHKEFVSTGPDDFVACGEMFEPIGPHYLSELWQRLMRRYSNAMLADTGKPVTVPRFHDLRHYAAHDLVRRGVNLRVLQRFLGHSSLATTEIYMPEVSTAAMAAAMAAPVRELVAV